MNNEIIYDPNIPLEPQYPIVAPNPDNPNIPNIPNSGDMINGNCPEGNFFYINDTNPNNPNNNINNCSSGMIIPKLNERTPPEFNQELIQIMKIKSEYQHFLAETFTKDVDKEDDEFIKITKVIDESIEKISVTMELFEKQQEKVLLLEKEMTNSYDLIRSDFKKIDEFSAFVATIDNKYKDIDKTNVTKSILEICESIKQKTDNLEIKQEYQKELYILKYLFHNFIKKMNQGNIGSTCSLCLQRQVDTFLEPCGHTACNGCIERYMDRFMDTDRTICNEKCFICRQNIYKFHKLFFL